MKYIILALLAVVGTQASAQGVRVDELGEINCFVGPHKRTVVSGLVYGQGERMLYADLKVRIKAGARIKEYRTQYVEPTKPSFYLVFESRVGEQLRLEIFGDDVGLMSSVRVGVAEPMAITCAYSPN